MPVYRSIDLKVRSNATPGFEQIHIDFVKHAERDFTTVISSNGKRFPVNKDVYGFSSEKEVDAYYKLLEESKGKILMQGGSILGLPDPTQVKYQPY